MENGFIIFISWDIKRRKKERMVPVCELIVPPYFLVFINNGEAVVKRTTPTDEEDEWSSSTVPKMLLCYKNFGKRSPLITGQYRGHGSRL